MNHYPHYPGNAGKPLATPSGYDQDPIWARIRQEAEVAAAGEPAMASYIYNIILRHQLFEVALANLLASRLGNEAFPSLALLDVLLEAFFADPSIGEASRADIIAVEDRDPAVNQYLTPMLYQKGFHAIQAYRVGAWLCSQGRYQTALYLQSRVAQCFSVDIHPCASIGQGILIDHAHSIVIGETAVVGDNVSMLHEVTLGGTGKDKGDRHPKVGNGVLIGTGAKILGNIRIGDGARVGAGSVVLEPVPDGCTVVGVPAKLVKCPESDQEHECWGMDHVIKK